MTDIHPVDQTKDERIKVLALRAYDDAKRNADAALARREAMRRGDVQLPEHESVTILPKSCAKCDDTLNFLNASPVNGLCITCYDEPKQRITWKAVAMWLVVGSLAAYGAGQLIGLAMFKIGGMIP